MRGNNGTATIVEESPEDSTGGRYEYGVPLVYIHKGTTFLALSDTMPSRILMTAAMDGHAVSDSYGRIIGSDYYLSKATGYLNVQIKGFDEHYSVTRCTSQTIYSRDGWLIRVQYNDYQRYQRDLKAEQEAETNAICAKARAEKSDAKEKIQDQIKKAEALLADARSKLSELG
jgi:hypothetical protein